MVPTLPCSCPACRQWVPSRLLRPPAVCPSPGRPGLAPAKARPPALAPPVNAPPPSPHAARPSRRRSLHSSLASVFSQCVRGPFSLAAVSGCHCPCVGRPPAFLGGARSRLCPRCLCVPGTPPVCSGSQSALRAGPSVSGLFPLRLSLRPLLQGLKRHLPDPRPPRPVPVCATPPWLPSGLGAG